MKAKKEQNENGTESTESTQEAPVLIMTKEKMIAVFAVYETKVNALLEEAKVVKVDTKETLQVAENKSSQISDLIKEVEKARTKTTRPFLDTKKKIDELAKKFTGPLEQASELYKTAILAYKQLQVATESIAAEEKFNDLEKIEAEKKTEADRLLRIRRMVNASIFGGSYVTKNGETKTKAGCQKPADCDELTANLESSFPKLEEFKHFREEAAKTVVDLKASILVQKANLIRLGSENDKERQAAFEAINESRTDANVAVNEKEQKITKQIAKEINAETKKIQSGVNQAGKNIRRTVDYELVDLNLIPKEYLQLNTSKVDEYKSANLETIKLLLEESYEKGETIISGIKFFFQETYTNR